MERLTPYAWFSTFLDKLSEIIKEADAVIQDGPNKNLDYIKECRGILEKYKPLSWDRSQLFLKFTQGSEIETNYMKSDKNNLYLYWDGKCFFYILNDGTRCVLEDQKEEIESALQREFKGLTEVQPIKCMMTGSKIGDAVLKITSEKGHTCGDAIYLVELENEIYPILSQILPDQRDITGVFNKIKYEVDHKKDLDLGTNIIITQRILDYIDKKAKVNEERFNHLKNGQYEKAILDEEGKELKPYSEFVYKKYGDTFLANGQYDKAISAYSRAIELNPDYADAYFHRGIAHDKKDKTYPSKKDLQEADEDYTKAIELNPKNATYYYTRGVFASTFHPYYNEHIIADYTKAIELNPDYADAYVSRSAEYFKKNNITTAIIDCYEASQRKFDGDKLFEHIKQHLKIKKEIDWSEEDESMNVFIHITEIKDRLLQIHILKYALDKNSPLGKWFNTKKSLFNSHIRQKMEDWYAYLIAGEKFLEQNVLPGDGFLDKKQYPEAISSYTETFALNPEAAYSHRGIAHYRNKQFIDAISDFTQALALNPKSAEYYVCRGRAYGGQALTLTTNPSEEELENSIQAFTKATEDFAEAIKLDPSIKDTAFDYCDSRRRKLIVCLCSSKKYEEAIKVYLITPLEQKSTLSRDRTLSGRDDVLNFIIAIVAMNKTNPVEQNDIRNNMIKELINEILHTCSSWPTGLYYKILQIEDEGLRIEVLAYALDENSPLGKWFKEKNIIKVEQIDPQAPMHAYYKILKTHYDNKLSYQLRGHELYENKLYREAIVDFNKAIKLDPKQPSFYLDRARAFYAINDFEKAISDINKAIELDENHAKAYYVRAGIFGSRVQNDLLLVERIKDCTKAIELDPKLEEAKRTRRKLYLELAEYYYHQKGDAQTALKKLDEAIEVDPSAENYYNRAEIYIRQGVVGKALIDLCEGFYHQVDNENFNKQIEGLLSLRSLSASQVYGAIQKIENEQTRIKVLKYVLNKESPLGQWFSIHSDNMQSEMQAYLDTLEAIHDGTFSFEKRALDFCQKKEFLKAIADFNEVIRSEEPTPKPSSYLNRGLAYLESRQTLMANADFTKVIEIYSKVEEVGDKARAAEAYHYRSIARKQLAAASPDVWSAAIFDCETALQLDPTMADAKRTLSTLYGDFARLLHKRCDFKRALEVQNKAIAVDPSAANYYSRAITNLYLRRQVLDLSDTLSDFCEASHRAPPDDKNIQDKIEENLKAVLPEPEQVFAVIKNIEDKTLQHKILSWALDKQSPLGKWFDANTKPGSSFLPTGTIYQMKKYYEKSVVTNVSNAVSVFFQANRQWSNGSGYFRGFLPEIYARITCWLAGPDFNPSQIFDKYFPKKPNQDSISSVIHFGLFAKPKQIENSESNQEKNPSEQNYSDKFSM